MAFSTAPTFHKRRNQIVRNHQIISRKGGEMQIGPDGLLTVRRKRGGTGIPYRGLILLTALFFGAKALMYMQDGAQTYGERVAKLAEGGSLEQAGAWIMQADPMTVMIAQYLQQLFS